MWQHCDAHRHVFQWVVKSEKERIAELHWWHCWCFLFLPLFTKYSTVIESQGQRNRQLRMRDCMHSFNTCHSKVTSLQSWRKNLKREKLKPYPQPSRSEILANQEREEIGGKRENMDGWVGCRVQTVLKISHYGSAACKPFLLILQNINIGQLYFNLCIKSLPVWVR